MNKGYDELIEWSAIEAMPRDLSAFSSEALMQATAARLRLVMGEAELKSVQELADLVGASRSQASNWLQAYHLPPVPFMAVLCKRMQLTLDWIYLGDPSCLPHNVAIRLAAREQSLEVPSFQNYLPAEEPMESLEPMVSGKGGVVRRVKRGRSRVS